MTVTSEKCILNSIESVPDVDNDVSPKMLSVLLYTKGCTWLFRFWCYSYFEINEWHTLSCSSNCVGLYLISVCDKEASAWTPNYKNVIRRQTVSSYLYPYFQYYIRMRIPYPSTRVEGICGVVQYSNGRLHLHIVHALTSCRYWSMMCISSSIIMNCNCNTKKCIQYRGAANEYTTGASYSDDGVRWW